MTDKIHLICLVSMISFQSLPRRLCGALLIDLLFNYSMTVNEERSGDFPRMMSGQYIYFIAS